MINCKGETMNKSELVDAIASGSGLTKADASRVLETFMSTVTDALKSGDQVVIPWRSSCNTWFWFIFYR